MTRRYWVFGALSVMSALVWPCVIPLIGSYHLLHAQWAQAASVIAQPSASTDQQAVNGQPVTELALTQEQFRQQKGLPAASSPLEQGRLAYQAGRYAEAVDQFHRAHIASQAGPALEQAQALSFLSLGQQKLGDWVAAERSLHQGLALIQPLAPSRAQQLTLGRILNTQGSLFFAKGQTREALSAWQAAEAAYRQAQDERRQLGSLLNQSQALQLLGFYGRARKTLEEVHQRLASQPCELRLFGLQNLANMYWRTGDLRNSEQVLRQALNSAPADASPQQLSGLWVGLGNIEQAHEHWQRSLQHYQKAAALAEGEPRFQARLNQFQLLIRLNQQAKARALIPPLTEQLRTLSPRRSVLYGATNFANSLTQLAFAQPSTKANRSKSHSKPNHAPGKIYDPESFQLANNILVWSLKTAQVLGDTRAETYAQGYLGHLYERSHDWEKARQLTQAASTQAERINAQDIGYQWQWQLARILKAQNQLAPAEKAYHNAFDMLQSLRADLAAAQPDLQFSFRESVEPVYREFVDLLLRPVAPGTEPGSEALKLARDVIEALQIAELNDFFHTACLQDQLTPLEQVDNTGAAILYPIVLRDRVTTILSLPQQPLRSFSTNIPQDQFEQTIGQFRASLEKPYTDPDGKMLGQQLYDYLIRPAEAQIESSKIKTLTFVLDGALRNIPMAALRNRDRYLIQDYSIALTPGLQLIDPKPIQLKNKRTLLAGITEAVLDFPALPNVKAELDIIQNIVAKEVVLQDRTFTHASLAESVQSSDLPVIHLATHGEFSSNADETFILTWQKKLDVHTLSSILRAGARPDPIELLVLSACETASGDDRAALGLAGLSVQAGARSTLASLWSLDDESGAAFAQEFYKALQPGNMSRAEAIQTAQLALLNDPRYRKPQSWASYVLLGNWL